MPGAQTGDAPTFHRGIAPKQAFGLQLPFTEGVTSYLRQAGLLASGSLDILEPSPCWVAKTRTLAGYSGGNRGITGHSLLPLPYSPL